MGETAAVGGGGQVNRRMQPRKALSSQPAVASEEAARGTEARFFPRALGPTEETQGAQDNGVPPDCSCMSVPGGTGRYLVARFTLEDKTLPRVSKG